jgi:adenylate cyclase
VNKNTPSPVAAEPRPDIPPPDISPIVPLDAMRLPPRVQDALKQQRRSSEILIGWVQLAVVAAFGTLYWLSPKTFPAEAEFFPIPWVLGAYAAFTVLRLGLAYRVELPNWLLALSVIVDMALLMGTIWSFHQQYMQPAAFYLKAPTLLYVFIFIALRTLRFEPVFVALSGGVAALGWIGMVIYAIELDPLAAPLTRDYVYYLTSNAILIGAEFDKVISILMVTAILVWAIVRARRLLVRSVTDQLATQELSRFMDRDVAARIADMRSEMAIGHGEIRDAAVVQVDIRGFSALSNRIEPHEVLAILSEYQALVVPILRRHGGSIDKFLGDGILASFGATNPSPTAAADALRAVEAVAAALSEWQVQRAERSVPAPGYGLAAASGRVVFGAVGDADRREITVIGRAVNLSARLEKHTKVEQVQALCDHETYERATSQGYLPLTPPRILWTREVEGVDTPVDLVVLAR